MVRGCLLGSVCVCVCVCVCVRVFERVCGAGLSPSDARGTAQWGGGGGGWIILLKREPPHPNPKKVNNLDYKWCI